MADLKRPAEAIPYYRAASARRQLPERAQRCDVVRHWWPAELDYELDQEVFLEPDTMAVETCSTVSPAVTSV